MNAPGCSRSEPPARAAWPRAWHMPVQLRTGSACSAELPALLQGRRAVVLAFAQAEALGARQRLLPQAEWLYVPDGLASLDAARALSARLWPLMDDQTALVALGGGTVMDLAKWLRHRPALGFEALCEALREGRPAPGRKALLVLLPSTAGTGSEVSRSATLWDLQAADENSMDEEFVKAIAAVVKLEIAQHDEGDIERPGNPFKVRQLVDRIVVIEQITGRSAPSVQFLPPFVP